MKKVLLFLFLLSQAFRTFAQNAIPDSSIVSLTKLDLGFQGVGLSYEPRINSKMAIDFAAGVGGGYNVSEVRVNYRWSFSQPSLYFMVTPKIYYNRKRRIEKGKDVRNNAGNYWGIKVTYTSGNNASDYRNSVSPSGLINLHWGIQRSLGDKWILNAHAGLGYAKDFPDGFGTIYPALEFKFSYLFKKSTK